MPAFNNISELQAGAILSFLRTSAATVATPDAPVTLGDATRGRAIFEGKGECLKCHRVNGQGARWAPDLSTVGAPRGGGGGGGRGAAPAPAAAAPAAPAAEPSPQQLQQLQRALLDPNADVADANRTYRAVMQGGETITGKLLNLDTFYAQLLDTTDRLVTVDKQKARQFGVIPSPMPSYRDKLSAQELSDLLGYLASLK
jgi:mono/diheme cytochrome c family protein